MSQITNKSYEQLDFESTIGTFHLRATSLGISGVTFDQVKAEKQPEKVNDLLNNAKTQLVEYLAGKRKSFDLPLDLSNLSGFQKNVLEITREIKFGETLSYKEIASKLGKPKASRAVGNALRLNPIWIIIPCHRVVAADGLLSGYAGGLDVKKKLLEWEGQKIVGEKLG